MLPNFSMFVEYICRDCNIKELHCEIIPKHPCPKCGFFFEVNEEVKEEGHA
ncbi:hypothetical protein [Cytobacillus depressus]|uniref:hypothetical protein n=1 Tax=Cytobacillus depressus TaxID=1602942 RepID=UPI001478F5ED|nr:hypothetical protein [Cytobacillus depressus]